jgi:hypothetical protein
LQNSGISSLEAASASPSSEGATRKRFALTGVSPRIDPRVDAVRPDLADIRLADRVFAPHYAAPLTRHLARAVALREGPKSDSSVMTQLDSGDQFDVLEFAGANAWGVAPKSGLVGYIDAAAIEESTGK